MHTQLDSAYNFVEPILSGLREARLNTTYTRMMAGRNGFIECETYSPQTTNIDSEIQLIGPTGDVIAETNSSDILTYMFTPFTVADVGQYSCRASVSFPDNPELAPIMLRRDFTLDLPASKGVVSCACQSQLVTVSSLYTI